MIDNLILRMAISEMLYVNDTPLKVSIAEAIEIAKFLALKIVVDLLMVYWMQYIKIL